MNDEHRARFWIFTDQLAFDEDGRAIVFRRHFNPMPTLAEEKSLEPRVPGAALMAARAIRQRDEAEVKLRKAEADNAELRDIIAGSKLKNLKRHSEKAKKLRALNRSIAELERRVATAKAEAVSALQDALYRLKGSSDY